MANQVVADKRGYYVQGGVATALLKVTDFEGNPLNPENIVMVMYEDSDPYTVVLSGEATFGADGFYVYDWTIPADQSVGNYTITWNYTVDGEAKEEIQHIVVAAKGAGSAAYASRLSDFRIALEKYLCCAQNIPVYAEEAKPSADFSKYRFTFKRWNQSPGVRIFRNNKLLTSGFNVNFFDGYVTLGSGLTEYDRVEADYNFRWFSDEALDRFLVNAVQIVNSYPAHTSYTINSVIDRYIPIVIYLAAADALRELIMCLQFQQPQEVFGGPDKAAAAASTFESLKQNYEKTASEVLANKKFASYVGLTRAVVTPEFTLPGSRSRWFRDLFK